MFFFQLKKKERQSSKKIERRIKDNQPNWVAEFRDFVFLVGLSIKKTFFFFHLAASGEK